MLPIIIVISFIFISGFHVYNKWIKQFVFGDHKSCSRGSKEVDCVVCLCEVSEGEKLRVLSGCKHSFHVDCIDAWLRVRPTCPLCRINVAPHQNFLVSCFLSFGKRVVKWIENPLCLEFTYAVCESFGYI